MGVLAPKWLLYYPGHSYDEYNIIIVHGSDFPFGPKTSVTSIYLSARREVF
jgi:hypothetical protein